jgi:hypothetical protein
MSTFDIPNDEELQPYIKHDYDLINKNYPISDNFPESDYNQFIQLRDTLVYSSKYYKGKKGSKLVIGEKENTVEIIYRN